MKIRTKVRKIIQIKKKRKMIQRKNNKSYEITNDTTNTIFRSHTVRDFNID